MGVKGHPFLVLVAYPSSFCGASIISKRYVLTAGHCVTRNYTEKDTVLVAGLHDRVVKPFDTWVRLYSVEKIIYHPKYEVQNEVPINDIGLLRTTKDIEFSHYIQPVCLPFKLDYRKFKAVMVMGWGLTKEEGTPSRLARHAYLTLLSDKDCDKAKWKKAWIINHRMMFCAYNRKSDSCQGDSGGPVVVKDNSDTYYQIGIVSFGEGCHRFGKPGIYTKVKSYISWIKEHVREGFCSP